MSCHRSRRDYRDGEQEFNCLHIFLLLLLLHCFCGCGDRRIIPLNDSLTPAD